MLGNEARSGGRVQSLDQSLICFLGATKDVEDVCVSIMLAVSKNFTFFGLVPIRYREALVLFLQSL